MWVNWEDTDADESLFKFMDGCVKAYLQRGRLHGHMHLCHLKVLLNEKRNKWSHTGNSVDPLGCILFDPPLITCQAH